MDRRLTQIMHTQEREKKKDTGEYYIKNQHTGGEYRLLTLSNTDYTMKWELQPR